MALESRLTCRTLCLRAEGKPDEAMLTGKVSSGEIDKPDCGVNGKFLLEATGSESPYIKIGLVPQTALWGGYGKYRMRQWLSIDYLSVLPVNCHVFLGRTAERFSLQVLRG